MKKNYAILLTSVLAGNFLFAQTWTKVSSSSMGSNLRGVLVHNNTIFSSTSTGGVASASDGATWSLYDNGLTATGKQTKRLGKDNAYLYVGTPDGVYRSNDNGNSWSNTATNLNSSANNFGNYFGYYGGTTFCVMSANQNNGGGLFRSTDNGTTWTQSQSGIPTNAVLTNIIEVGSELFIGTATGMYKSTDNGLNWTSVTVPAAAQYSALFNHNGRLIAYCNHPTSGGILYSDDNGGTWQNASGVPTGGTAGKTLKGLNDTLYTAIPTKGIYASYDNGLNWNAITGNLSILNLSTTYDMEFFNGHLYVACFDGIMSNGTGSGSGVLDNFLENVASVFPNPTNGKLKIEINEKHNAEILEIYTIMGKQLLAFSPNQKMGTIEIDLSDFAEGTYFLKVYDGSQVYNKKIVKH